MLIKALVFFFLLSLLLFPLAKANNGGGLISPAKLEMFVDELPAMPKVEAFEIRDEVLVTTNLTIGMFQKQWKFHRDLPSSTVFAFGTSYETATVPGPTIEAIQGIATYITWENHLPSKHILPFDTSFPVATPKYGGVPTAVHLHGGIHPPTSDGNPTAWFTNSFQSTGPSFVSPTNFYPNVQEPGNLWYHDHALGLTRVNILTGLAGPYVIRNPSIENSLHLPSGPDFDRHLIVFDRSFRTDGSIFLNATGDNPSIHPEWQPEYFGDAIIVNGKVWPKLYVTRRKYRFRIINASNSRFYNFYLSNGLTFIHVGSDSTYLDKPVTSSKFLLGPSEIADVIVDFSNSTTDSAVLSNDAPYPYPTGNATDQYNGKVMKFIIQKDKIMDPSRVPKSLIVYPPPEVQQAAKTRYITMYEYDSATGAPTHLVLNNKTFEDPPTEMPKVGTTEIWYVLNLTPDNHPLHIHLALFITLEQQELLDLDVFKACMAKMNDAVGCHLAEHARGAKVAVPEYESGWKNVFKMMPGYVTKIVVQFSLLKPGVPYPFDATAEPGYVYHCHIVDHEDNVMMRPLKLTA